MKALDLVLKEKWYRMIESGEKTEEYREIKPFWEKRMQNCRNRHYDKVTFHLGYAKNRPSMTFALDKIFKKEGVYNVEAHDQFHSDAGEFATYLLEMARVAHHNQSNADKVYEFMHTLRNLNVKDEDNTFCLDDEDIKHYRLKD